MQLEPVTKLVALALADAANNKQSCWPSLPTLTQKCCLSRSSIIRALDQLAEDKIIVRKTKSGKVTTYLFTEKTKRLPVSHRHPCHTATRVPQTLTRVTQTPPSVTQTPPGPPPNLYRSPPLENRTLTQKNHIAADAAKSLVKEFSAKFIHYRVTDPKQTKLELAAATALLASATANEVLELAEHALNDKFAGTRRCAANLRQLSAHFSELRAQFPAAKSSSPTDWEKRLGDKTVEERQQEWPAYLAACKELGIEPNLEFKPPGI